MTNTAIVYPILAQVALTMVLMTWMAMARVRAANRGEVRLADIALDSSAWPSDIVKIGNCVLNQFQTPVLFYVLCVLLMITAKLDILQVILAWVFVTGRVVHAYIHTGTNNVLHRFYAFLVAFVALALMWIYFAIGITIRSL